MAINPILDLEDDNSDLDFILFGPERYHGPLISSSKTISPNASKTEPVSDFNNGYSSGDSLTDTNKAPSKVEEYPDKSMMDSPDSPPNDGPSESSGSFNVKLQAARDAPTSNGNAKGARSTADKEIKPNFGAPGSSYNTKKFQEDYERESHKLLDKDWAPKFGDPLLK